MLLWNYYDRRVIPTKELVCNGSFIHYVYPSNSILEYNDN